MTWHGEPVVDIPAATAADGPVYTRPLARPAAQDELAADDPAALPRPADGAGLRADLLALLGLARPGRQELGHRPVRPVRPRRHRPGHAGGRRAGPGGRGDRARHRAGHRRQRPLRPARSLPGHPAGAVRGVPERGGDRGAAAGRDELPELRLAGRSRGDVAVRRGGARARGRLRRPRRAGHRRERQLLQPDGHDGHPPHPGHRGARRARRRAPPGRHRVPGRRGGGRHSSCSAGPSRSSAGRPGRTSCHGHLGGRPPRPTWTPSGGWPGCSPRRPRPGCWPPRTTCPTAAWPSRWPSPACGAGPAARSGCPVTRSPPCSASRPGAAVVAVRPGREAAFAGSAAAHEVPGQDIGTTGGDSLTVAGLLRDPAGRARGRARRDAARVVRLSGPAARLPPG